MFALFRNRNFLFLWLGQLCSQFGDRLTQVILVALVAARASGSTLSLAKVLVITSLPALLLNPFAGAYVDRWDRKRTMILCDLIRAVVIASFPWLAASPSVTPLYCGIFLVFAVAAFFIPARLAIIPDLVSENQLSEANALFTSSGMIGSTFTILIGAFLVEWIGTTRSCWINGASYVASALFILPIIRPARAARESEASPRILFQEVAEGLRELWIHSDTRRIILLLAVLMGGAGASIVVGTVLIQQSLGSVTKDVGILSLWAGVGMLLGAVAYGRWGTRTSRRKVVAFSFLGAGLSLWFFLWMVIGFRSGVGASAATTLLGFCLAPVGVVANTFVHEGHVERLHGRIFSSLGIIVNLSFITASLIAGWLAERSSRGAIVGAVGFLYAVGGVILLCYTEKRRGYFQ